MPLGPLEPGGLLRVGLSARSDHQEVVAEDRPSASFTRFWSGSMTSAAALIISTPVGMKSRLGLITSFLLYIPKGMNKKPGLVVVGLDRVDDGDLPFVAVEDGGAG